jgi:hypothetical protein
VPTRYSSTFLLQHGVAVAAEQFMDKEGGGGWSRAYSVGLAGVKLSRFA